MEHNSLVQCTCAAGLIVLGIALIAAQPASSRSFNSVEQEETATARVTQLLVEALAYNEAAKYETAETILLDALTMLPDHIPTLIVLGKHHAKLGNMNELHHLKKAEALIEQGVSNEAEHRLALGHAYVAAVQSARATRQFDLSIRIAQQRQQPLLEAQALIALGRLQVKNSEFEEAERALGAAGKILGQQVASKVIPQIRIWLMAIAEFHEKRGAMEEAFETFLKLAELSVDAKDHAHLFRRLGEIQLHVGDCMQALGYIQEALRFAREGYGEEHPTTSNTRDRFLEVQTSPPCS